MASLLDLFGLKPKRSQSDDIFLDTVRSLNDVWSEIMAHNASLACPSSASLVLGETITKEYIMTHVMMPDKRPGEFINMLGQKLQIIGSEIVTGSDFFEQRKVKIITAENIEDANGSMTMYRVNRPLLGGIASPEEPDEVTTQIMHKYVVMVRSFPEAESVFKVLDKYIQEVIQLGLESPDGYSKIKPSMKVSVETQWRKCTERLSLNTVTSGLGHDTATSKIIIGQIVESYILLPISQYLYPWMCRQLLQDSGTFLSNVASMECITQTDLSIRPEFQCSQYDAIRYVRSLGDASTPIDKLAVLKKTVMKIREAVDHNVQGKFYDPDFELATDDIVSFVIWVIIKASKYYSSIFYDIKYAAEYHFVSASTSDLGFCLNHFQVAVAWIMENADKYKSTVNGDLVSYSSKSSNIVQDESLPIYLSGSISIHNFMRNFREFHSIATISDDNKKGSSSTSSVSTQMQSERSTVSQEDMAKFGKSISILELTADGAKVSKQVEVISDETTKPVAISSIYGGKDIYGAIDKYGDLYCWGSPDCGQLGIDLSFEFDSFLPVPRPVLINVVGKSRQIKHISCGKHHTIAITKDGEVYSWGDNRCAQLGVGVNEKSTTRSQYRKPPTMSSVLASSPVLVEAVKHEFIVSAACGSYHSLVLTANGAIYSWGRASNGRLGQFSDKRLAEHMVGKPALVKGPWVSLSLLANEKSSTPTNSSKSPVDGPGDEVNGNVVSAAYIAAGFSHSIAITSRGDVYSWGCGMYGRLGHGSHIDEYLPKQVLCYFEGFIYHGNFNV